MSAAGEPPSFRRHQQTTEAPPVVYTQPLLVSYPAVLVGFLCSAEVRLKMLLRKKMSSWLQNCNCLGSVPAVGGKKAIVRQEEGEGWCAVLCFVLLLCAGAEVVLHPVLSDHSERRM